MMKLILMILLSVLTLTGCTILNNDDSEYLNFTYTYNDDNETINSLSIVNMSVDISTGIVHEHLRQPLTAQSSKSVYDRKNNIVWYTGKVNNIHADQLFKYEIDNDLAEPVTNNLFAINEIIPLGNYVYISAVEVSQRNISPYLYDIDTGNLFLVEGWDQNLMISDEYYDVQTNEIYITGHNADAERKSRNEGCYEQYPPHFYKINSNLELEYLFTGKDSDNVSVIRNYDDIFVYKSTSYLLNDDGWIINSNDEYVTVDKSDFTEISREPFKMEEVIAYENEDYKYTIDKHKIIQVDLKKSSEKLIFEIPISEAAINNYIVLND